jgi:hypothetical protein
MIITLLCAALLGGVIGAAELVTCYRDRPGQAVLSPSGLIYIFLNATASVAALVAVETFGFRFGLPETISPVSVHVVQVMTAALGSAALFRTSVTLAQDRGITMGPISLLHGILKIVDGAMNRKRSLSRLSGNELDGLSFARDHAALAELCCHALPRFDLAEAQRLGELAADLRACDDLTDADKLDCFGLELSRLVGERALGKAAVRLRDRPQAVDDPQGRQRADELRRSEDLRRSMEQRRAEELRRSVEQRRPAEPRAAETRAEARVTGAERTSLDIRDEARREPDAGSRLAGTSSSGGQSAARRLRRSARES